MYNRARGSGTAISSRSRATVVSTLARVGPPPPRHSPGQKRLVELFLKNTPKNNDADPRPTRASVIVDAALKTARDRGETARMV